MVRDSPGEFPFPQNRSGNDACFPGGSDGKGSARNAGDLGLIPGWETPWTEEPGGLQSMGWERVRHDQGNALTHTYTHVRAHTHPCAHTVHCLRAAAFYCVRCCDISGWSGTSFSIMAEQSLPVFILEYSQEP